MGSTGKLSGHFFYYFLLHLNGSSFLSKNWSVSKENWINLLQKKTPVESLKIGKTQRVAKKKKRDKIKFVRSSTQLLRTGEELSMQNPVSVCSASCEL